jgi:hypothetical protein
VEISNECYGEEKNRSTRLTEEFDVTAVPRIESDSSVTSVTPPSPITSKP